VLAGRPAERLNFARNIVGDIVGNIEGYAATTLGGNYPDGSLLATLRHLKSSASAGMPAPASGLPSVSTPKLKGVDSDMEKTVQGCWHFAGSAGKLTAD